MSKEFEFDFEFVATNENGVSKVLSVVVKVDVTKSEGFDFSFKVFEALDMPEINKTIEFWHPEILSDIEKECALKAKDYASEVITDWEVA